MSDQWKSIPCIYDGTPVILCQGKEGCLARVDLGVSEDKGLYPQMRFVFLRLISVVSVKGNIMQINNRHYVVTATKSCSLFP